jgi:hypothetical protein
VGRNVAYVSTGTQPEGVRCRLAVGFRDETVTPSRPGLFEHKWVVGRAEIQLAESQGRIDQFLLGERTREQTLFLEEVERTLRQNGTHLVRVDHDLVLRPME